MKSHNYVRGGTLAQKFFPKTERQGDCLVWVGARMSNGYGQIWWDGRVQNAHRAVFELSGTPLPDESFVDHKCHNRACVEMSHLRVVSKKENGENRGSMDRRNTSGFRGVARTSCGLRWRAYATHHGVQYSGGSFDNIEDANNAAVELRNRLFTHNDLDRISSD